MTKRNRIIIATIVILILLGYGGFWLTYNLSMQEANKEGLARACRENIGQEFVGEIIEIDRYEQNSFMHGRFFNLHIRINDTTKEYVDYQYNLTPNKEILEFAKVGQKAVKVKGQDTYKLIDSKGKEMTYKVAKCASIE